MLILRARFLDRRKVLRHHPDKKANSGDANNDSFFKCIQKGEPPSLVVIRRTRHADSMMTLAQPTRLSQAQSAAGSSTRPTRPSTTTFPLPRP